jgi:large repetitive protein
MSRKIARKKSFLARLHDFIFGSFNAIPLRSRRLCLESLENRRVMAEVGQITGVIYRDSNNNGTHESAEVSFAGVSVQLYRDNGNNTFESAVDALVTAAVTDSTGAFNFANVDAASYFVRRPAQTIASGPQTGVKLTEKVSSVVKATSLKTMIDDFENPLSQTAAVDTTNDNTPATSVLGGLPGTNTLGGEREIITNFTGSTTGAGILMSARVSTITIGGNPLGLLLMDATTGAKGVNTVVWDGADGTTSVTPNTTTGLGIVDLTLGGATEIRTKLTSVDLPGATLRVTVYSSASQISTASLPLLARVTDGVPVNGGQTDYAFSFNGSGSGAFTTATGASAGADFTKVRAVTMTVDVQSNDIDASFDSIATYGTPDAVVNLAVDEVDVSIEKLTSTMTPTIGDNVTFTLIATNATTLPNGRATIQATGVVAKDLIFTDSVNGNKLTYVSDTASGAFNSTTGIWNVGSLNPGESKSITVTMRVNATAIPKVINTVNIIGVEQPDPDVDDWTSSKELTPKFIDIGLTKTVSVTRPNHEQSIVFTVTATNNGTADASEVRIEDILTGANFSSLDITNIQAGAGSSYDQSSGIWTITTLTAGRNVQLTVTGTVIECDPIINTARLLSVGNGIDTIDTNNSATATATPAAADLSIAKTVVANGASPPNTTPSKSNPTIKYAITVRNNGPDNATGIIVNDQLPSGLVFVSSDSTAYNPSTGVWQLGNLSNGLTRTLNVIARLADGALPTTIENTATITDSNQCDDDTANNTSTTLVTPQVIDLSVTKAVDQSTVTVGNNVTWTMTVTNSGPSAATGVQLRDTLPAGVTYVSDTKTRGTFAAGTGVWDVGNLGVNETVTLTITSKVNVTTLQTNVIEVTAANQTDIDSTPNNGVATEDDRASATVTATPIPQVDLSVTKIVSNATPTIGSDVTWTMTVSNTSQVTATGVNLRDVLPAGVRYVTHATAKGSYDVATGIWNVITLAPGETATLSIGTTVTGNTVQTNTIEVSAANQTDIDSTPSNGIATEDDQASASINPVPIVIDPVIDLNVTKTVDNSRPTLNSNVTFTMTVTNSGPAVATGVSLVDQLPSGLVFVGASTLKGAFNSANNTWTVGTLAVNETATLFLTARASTLGIKTNVIEVFAAEQRDIDSTPNNNIATEDDRATALVDPQLGNDPQGDPDPPTKRRFLAR